MRGSSEHTQILVWSVRRGGTDNRLVLAVPRHKQGSSPCTRIRAPGAGSRPLRVPIAGCHRIRAIRGLGCILAGGLLAFSAMSPTAFAYRVPPPERQLGPLRATAAAGISPKTHRAVLTGAPAPTGWKLAGAIFGHDASLLWQ
jgi:hypothetical protein